METIEDIIDRTHLTCDMCNEVHVNFLFKSIDESNLTLYLCDDCRFGCEIRLCNFHFLNAQIHHFKSIQNKEEVNYYEDRLLTLKELIIKNKRSFNGCNRCKGSLKHLKIGVDLTRKYAFTHCCLKFCHDCMTNIDYVMDYVEKCWNYNGEAKMFDSLEILYNKIMNYIVSERIL